MTLKGAFIGFGAVAAHGHWPAYRWSDRFSIVAVVDPVESRRKEAERLLPDVKTYATLDDLAAHETIDFIDICTPPAYHWEPLLFAVKKGWHVLCEKPLLLNAADFQTLLEKLSEKPVAVFPVHNWKYAPIFRKASALIREGRIGEVRTVEMATLREEHCKGAPEASADWRRDPAVAGGGILIDHGWHAFYLLLGWMPGTPQRVKARLNRPAPSALEDDARVLVYFPGGHAYFHLTWRARARRNAAMIVGERGTLLIDDDRLWLTASGRKEEFVFSPPLSQGSHHADWFSALLADFARAIETPFLRETTLHEAGWCLAMIQATYQCEKQAGEAVPVEFPQALVPSPPLREREF